MSQSDSPYSRPIPNEQMSSSIVRWRCKNCGQFHFTAAEDTPPDVCAYCQDMTTWERVPPIGVDGVVSSDKLLFWCCENCGQIYFAAEGNDPPAKCAQCRQRNSYTLYRR